MVMSKWDFLEYFYTNGVNYGCKRTFLILLAGLAAGMIIYLTYYLTSEKVVYSRKYNWSLVMVLLTTEVIMLVISSNIVVSLGMVGALSIVRYRTAVKDSRDTAFMFWAITEGLAVSAQHYMMAFTAVAFIAAVVIVSSKLPGIYNRYLFVVRGNGSVESDRIESAFGTCVKGYQVRSVNRNEASSEYIIEVRVKGKMDDGLVKKILEIEGVDYVNYVVESGEKEG